MTINEEGCSHFASISTQFQTVGSLRSILVFFGEILQRQTMLAMVELLQCEALARRSRFQYQIM